VSVNTEFYLVIGQKFSAAGHQVGTPTIRTAKKKPHCASDEVAIALHLVLPDALFKKPSLQASIVVPDDQVPTVITTELSENIAAALKEQFGITLNISAPEPERTE
jgi:hypothetical protein